MGENILEVKHMTVSIYENGEEYKVVNRITSVSRPSGSTKI